VNREEFLSYAEDRFGVVREFPFDGDSITAVLRHSSNRKWFAIVMTVHVSRLGIDGDRMVDIVNLKCAPEVADSFRHERGVYPAYHMNKRHWISVLLDGSVEEEKLDFLLSVSYELTRTKIKRRKKV